MPSPKRTFPQEYSTKTITLNSLAESFPFTIKECGYCNERKFTLGHGNRYNEYLLLYSIEGTVRYTKAKQTQYVQANSVVVTACNTPLTFTRVSREWKYYYFIINGSHAKLYYNLIRTQNNVVLASPFLPILDCFMELYLIASGLKSGNDTWNYLHTSMQIQNIFTALYDLTNNIRTIKELTPAQETVVNIAVKYISENYGRELDIDTICGQVGFSKYYFCSLFKKQMGMTVHRYVNEFRINKAKELLAYSKLSVNSISQQVGFKTSLTFIRAFERSVHMTPTEYRDYYC